MYTPTITATPFTAEAMLTVQTDAELCSFDTSSYSVRWPGEATGLTVGEEVTIELRALDTWGNVIPKPMQLPLDGPLMVVATGEIDGQPLIASEASMS